MSVADAVAEWRRLLGDDHVVTDPSELALAERATFATTERIPAIIRPGSPQEVQDCMRIANAHSACVYPVSRGKNWGYGSRVPARDGCVLMELRRLDRVRELDETLAYATVEPGVTFAQLADLLEQRGSRLEVCFVGSTAEASVVGNTLERGFGSGQYTDRFAHACAFEVVLPSGDLVRTGLAGIPGAASPGAHRYGVGPYLDGLFTQSNLGVVTALTVWLAPRPAHAGNCYFGIQTEDRLAELVERLRWLVLDGPIRPILSFRNDYSALASAQQYPWGVLSGEQFPQVALDEMRARLFAETNWGAKWQGWLSYGGCSPEHLSANRTVVSRTIGSVVDRLVLLDRAGVNVVRWDSGDREKVRRHFATPHRTSHTAYWRKRSPIPADVDPDRDGCGVLYVEASVPLTGQHVAAAVAIAHDVMTAHELEPCIRVNVVAERSAVMCAELLFDRDLVGEDERALSCYAEAVEELRTAGYVIGRLGVQSMGGPPQWNPELWSLLTCVKRSLDRNGVLAIGRYGVDP
jgi:4-cresol dehydrogenase (hydroxylating)